MKAKDFVNEKWTEKYKRSIDCSHPKGFSQKAHCAGRKKNEDATAGTMPDTAMPDVKQPGKLKTGLKKVGKFLGRGLGALDFVDAAQKFSKGDIPGGAESTLSGITYAIPVAGLPLGLARDLAKEKGYDPLDYSSKAYPKGPKGETLYPITPFENKSNMLKGMLIAETHSTGTTIGSAGIGGGSGLGIEASPMTKILQSQIDEAGTRAGALNTAIQLYKSIQKGGLANEIELQQRQMRALMRKYGIGFEDMGVKQPPVQKPTPVTTSPSSATTTKEPKSWVDTLPVFDEPKPTSNYKVWEPLQLDEFLNTGGSDDGDDELKKRVIEMYFEDGLREIEISKIEGIPEELVHRIIDRHERGLDEGDVVSMKDDLKTVQRLAKQWWHGDESSSANAQKMLTKMGYEIYTDNDHEEIVLSKDGKEWSIHMDNLTEGEVVSLQAKKIAKIVNQYPIIFATASRKSHGINDVDLIFKDLRTNKIVAHVVGNNYRPIEINGKELGGPSYEIRINPQGLKSEGGPVSYLASGDPNHSKDKGKHRIFTLVPSEKKIEKSKGPGGTTKLRPDRDDVMNYMVTSGTYYGMDLIPKSDDDWYTFLEKELNGKIMDQDLAVELGYVYSKYDGDLVFLQQPQTISGEKITIPKKDWEDQGIESPYEPRTPNLQYFNLDDVKEEQDFKTFLQKSLTNKVEPAPQKYDPNTTMGFHNMPGYKNALDFGLKVISKMDDKTKRYYANKDEDVLLDYLLKIAKRNNLLIKEFSAPTDDDHAEVFRGGKFYEEDLFEVPGMFDEVFHDPNIGSEWIDLLKDHVNLKEYGSYDTKRIIQYSKDNPPNIDFLYQQFVQRMLNPENTVDPDDWIDKVNKYYGLNYKWRDYQERGRKDHTNNWQRIIQKYVVQRP